MPHESRHLVFLFTPRSISSQSPSNDEYTRKRERIPSENLRTNTHSNRNHGDFSLCVETALASIFLYICEDNCFRILEL